MFCGLFGFYYKTGRHTDYPRPKGSQGGGGSQTKDQISVGALPELDLISKLINEILCRLKVSTEPGSHQCIPPI